MCAHGCHGVPDCGRSVIAAITDHGMSRLHPDTRDQLRARYARNLIAHEHGIAS